MVTTLDVNKIFENCLKPLSSESLTATTVAMYLSSPFAIYCNKFVPENEKDTKSEYQQLLFERGNEHETQTVQAKYPDMEPISFATPQEGFKMVLESMAKGSKVMHGMPVFYLPEGLVGYADIIEKSTSGGSVFGGHHYTVKEIKLAKNIRDDHIIQGAFYNYMLGKIQGVTPQTFYIINRDGEELACKYSEYEGLLLDAIEGTRKILQGEPVSPTYGSCKFPWENYCNKMAEATKDISLVGGISLKTKNKLAQNGFQTLDDLACADMNELLKIKGVGGKTASKFVYTARAIQSQKPIIKDKNAISFPNCKVEMFLDLEGIDPSTAGDELVQMDYLIGVLIRVDSKEKYLPFVSQDLDHEKEMLVEFLEFVKKQQDYVIYHYHHYERVHLDKMMEKYEIDEKTRHLVFDNMIDIHKIATDSVYFPTYGTGLKPVAKFLGFSWRHKGVDATESIAMYLDYVANPKENKNKLDPILDYNEDDCIATRVVKDWLDGIRVK